ncbi:MAG TPA: SGNH/GDSL hydrolase family protein [Caulobacteraceae bacterium]|nr:SGNH/GDSL hydrolase family protein [Caulobacteraceae bacterium]
MKRLLCALAALLAVAKPAWAVPVGMGPMFSNTDAIPGAYNLSYANLANFRLALANTRAGVSDTVVNIIGDSTSAGVNSTGAADAVYANARVTSFPTDLAAQLTASGIPASADNWFGDGSAGAHGSTLAGYYPNVSDGSGWAPSALGSNIPGGQPDQNSTTTNCLTTTTALAEDHATIFYISTGSSASFTYQVDSGSVSGANSTTGSGINTLTISLGASATHSLCLQRTGSGTLYIAGVDFYNSTIHRVRIRNMGAGGSTTTQWAATASAWNPGLVLKSTAYQASLNIISLGINDWIYGVGAANTAANLTAIAGAVTTLGKSDVIIMTPFPTLTSVVTAAVQAPYVSSVRSVAGALNVPMIDWNGRVGGMAQAQSQGWAGSAAQYHPSIAGYEDIAAGVTRALVGAF